VRTPCNTAIARCCVAQIRSQNVVDHVPGTASVAGGDERVGTADVIGAGPPAAEPRLADDQTGSVTRMPCSPIHERSTEAT